MPRKRKAMRLPDKDIETMKKLMKDLFKVKEEETEILLRMGSKKLQKLILDGLMHVLEGGGIPKREPVFVLNKCYIKNLQISNTGQNNITKNLSRKASKEKKCPRSHPPEEDDPASQLIVRASKLVHVARNSVSTAIQLVDQASQQARESQAQSNLISNQSETPVSELSSKLKEINTELFKVNLPAPGSMATEGGRLLQYDSGYDSELSDSEPDFRIDDIDEGPVIVSESGFDPEALEIGGTGFAESQKSGEEFDYFPVKAREAFRAELAVAGIQLEEDGDQEDYETDSSEGNEEEEETETAEEHSGAAQEDPKEEPEEGEEEPEEGEEEPEEGEEEPEGGEEEPEEEDDFEAEGDGTGGRFDKERDTGQALRNNIPHYRLFRPGFHKTASDIGAGTAGTLADLIGTGGQQSGWFSFDMRTAGEAASALKILMRSGSTG